MTKLLARRLPAALVSGILALELANFLFGPFGMAKGKTPTDFLFLLLLVFHGVWVYRLLCGERELYLRSLFRTPEVLLVATLVLFLLSYIFAANANMSYVQRFAAMKGNIRLAPDSAIERLNSASRFVPLLAVQAGTIVWFRVRRPLAAARYVGSARFAAQWGLPLALLSAVLYTLALPSFVSLPGIGPLAFVALTPLFLCLHRSSYRWGVFYGVSFGVVESMLTSFWLGTFSLVSLQFVTVVSLVEYLLFMLLLMWLLRRMRPLAYLILPVAWVAFDYLRSAGFLGYPWGMLGVSQYRFTALIQVAALTGVWGVTFVAVLSNGILAHLLSRASASKAGAIAPVAAFAALFAALALGGAASIRARDARPPAGEVRVALVQQDTDPRKNDYGDTFAILKRLTNGVLPSDPDLIVWSETAFVPNIRKWSKLDPARYPYARLVREFLAYQKRVGKWLLTGNDDYSESIDRSGNVVRRDYNASVLFAPDGRRVETYHKIHLVPFTEYFPYKKQLPFIYNLLINFDVYLWEPGTVHTVFRTPKVTFSTPICFEDAFPNDVRQFVLQGAEIIVNISNDYWSLTDAEGMQHYVNALFRAVENRRPLLRAAASGVTGYVDTSGRLVRSLPMYEQAAMVVDVPLAPERETVYTRFGDWFPRLCMLVFLMLLFVSYSPAMRATVARSGSSRRSRAFPRAFVTRGGAPRTGRSRRSDRGFPP